MKKAIEKCPMCGMQTIEKCDLMVGEDENKTILCCCESLKKTSVKKQ